MHIALLNWISDLLWPLTCIGCRRKGVYLCRSCVDALPPTPPPSHIDAIPLISAGIMQSHMLERAVWHLKYRNAQGLAAPLGDLLGAALGRSGIHADLIVPIPLHPSRLRQRGYNQAELLAKRVALIHDIPCLPIIERTRNTTSQVVVRNRVQRLTNMSDAFQVINPDTARGRSILLIDDVATTGATLQAAAQALTRSGATRIIAATIARG